MSFDPVIIINVRDRVTVLSDQVAWLERAGHERIVLLDNASTWPECVEYLDRSPHEVIRLGENAGARSLWKRPDLDRLRRDWFVYTDPDLTPIEDCPLDLVAHLRELLDRHPWAPKAGPGLYLGDVPAYMPSLGHERMLMQDRLEPGVYRSAIDTTFALHRPNAGFDMLAIRTGLPYQARHRCRSWYCDQPLTDEDRYYIARARKDSEGSSWANRTAA